MLEKYVFTVIQQLGQMDHSLLNKLLFVQESLINFINCQITLGQNFLMKTSNIREKMPSLDSF